ncbi:MAG: amidohydrolase [Clostridia bacterium]|nr:amidohydrolase [Clostridia bacterium]
MTTEIIDFHTHPFYDNESNICAHKEYCNMSINDTTDVFKKLNVTKICGSVVSLRDEPNRNNWDEIKKNNNKALLLKEIYGDFYIPGFHIHPSYPEESIAEINRMDKLGIKLIGELVPYLDGWNDYSSYEFSFLLDEAAKHNMIVSFHTEDNDQVDEMVKNHKDVIFVAAHPGEYTDFMRHVERMKLSENYYLDLSGYGIFRYGMLRHAIDSFGAERILFGSDYPTCNPGMYVGGVLFDKLIKDSEKEKIFSLNAKRLLGL